MAALKAELTWSCERRLNQSCLPHFVANPDQELIQLADRTGSAALQSAEFASMVMCRQMLQPQIPQTSFCHAILGNIRVNMCSV